LNEDRGILGSAEQEYRRECGGSGVPFLSENNRHQASRGQQEAWVLSTLPRALAFATSLLRDRTLAEDVVHDCYLRLLQKAGEYDLLRDGTKLLFKAITNACIDRNYRERAMLSLDATMDEDSPRSLLVIDAKDEGPLQTVVRRELEDVVEDGLAQLPVSQRAAVELKSLGYSLQEIAEALGTSAGNAGVLIHRARKAMAETLARYAGPSDDE
jgi:RNA polymerase sigma factor (sigma-70 family)